MFTCVIKRLFLFQLSDSSSEVVLLFCVFSFLQSVKWILLVMISKVLGCRLSLVLFLFSLSVCLVAFIAAAKDSFVKVTIEDPVRLYKCQCDNGSIPNSLLNFDVGRTPEYQ